MEVVDSLSQGRAAAAQCGLFTRKSVPVILEPPCTSVQDDRPLPLNVLAPGYKYDQQTAADAFCSVFMYDSYEW